MELGLSKVRNADAFVNSHQAKRSLAYLERPQLGWTWIFTGNVMNLGLKARGFLAQANIADHRAGRCQTAQLLLAACRTYYFAKSSGQDAECCRAVIENYLSFPLPIRDDWNTEKWAGFVSERERLAREFFGTHQPIVN